MIFMILVVPPKMDRTQDILGSPPDRFRSRRSRRTAGCSQELWHRGRCGCGRRNGLRGCSLLVVSYRWLTGAAIRSRLDYAAWCGRGAGGARGLFPPLV